MSVLIFRLNGVSDEEANDVRELLNTNQFAFYETNAGRWGLSVAALWLKNKDQLEQARYLLAEYQQQRENNAKSNTDVAQQSIWQRVKEAPSYYLLLIVTIIAVATISVVPFLDVDG
ncbi:MAG: DUF6164 family protein [Oceanicoccus sp.]